MMKLEPKQILGDKREYTHTPMQMQKIEHMYMPREQMPRTLHYSFPHGVVTMWVDSELVLAVPGRDEDADRLRAVIDKPDEYKAIVDELCKGDVAGELAVFWLTEMEKKKAEEEAAAKLKAREGFLRAIKEQAANAGNN